MGRPERILRAVLLALIWGAWLALRAAWVLAEWLISKEGRAWCGKQVALILLVAGIALLPKAAGLFWGRMQLGDAVEIAAMQSAGLRGQDIETALRRRAFALGFTDIALQEEAVRVDLQAGSDGAVCAIEVDFLHRLNLYGWVAPPIRIHLQVEKLALPKPADRSLDDLLQ